MARVAASSEGKTADHLGVFNNPKCRYKILFLDVLFPLNLEKVIFVDADQIVRSDLKELIDMDLKGAPYVDYFFFNL